MNFGSQGNRKTSRFEKSSFLLPSSFLPTPTEHLHPRLPYIRTWRYWPITHWVLRSRATSTTLLNDNWRSYASSPIHSFGDHTFIVSTCLLAVADRGISSHLTRRFSSSSIAVRDLSSRCKRGAFIGIRRRHIPSANDWVIPSSQKGSPLLPNFLVEGSNLL